MPDLTPERLREIESRVRVFQSDTTHVSTSALLYCEDVEALLAALRQAEEERAQLAAAVAQSRNRFTTIAESYKRYDVLKSDLGAIATAALSGLSDPAACIKQHDAAVATKTLRIAVEGFRLAGDLAAAERLEKLIAAVPSLNFPQGQRDV